MTSHPPFLIGLLLLSTFGAPHPPSVQDSPLRFLAAEDAVRDLRRLSNLPPPPGRVSS